MAVQTTSIVFVRKNSTTLAPNASLTIPFSPFNGPALFTARSQPVPSDAIVGGPTPTIVPHADELIEAGLFGEPLRPLRRERAVEASMPLGAALGMDALLAGERLDHLVNGGFQPPPVAPDPQIRLTVTREKDDGVDRVHVFEDFHSRRFEITDVDSVVVGFAPEQWQAVFTNITSQPIQCFAEVLFQELRRLDVTTLPLQLLNRLMRQAISGLGLTLKLSGSTATLDFSHEAKEIFKLRPIEKDFGFSFLGDIRLVDTQVELSNAARPNEPGRFPRIRLTLEFEERGPEIAVDLGVGDLDLELSGLRFTIDLVMRNNVSTLAGNGHLRGDFPWLPFITSDISIDTDLRFSSQALGLVREGLNVILDAVDVAAFIATAGKARLRERIPTLRQVLVQIGEVLAREMSFDLSNYIQVALQLIVNRDFQFHGLRAAGEDWEVLSGPVPPPAPGGGGGAVVIPEPGPLPNATPIDGPQPESDLENLRRINHFVLLMLENRSYDHVLGFHTHPAHGNDPAFDGLTGTESNKITNHDPAVPRPMPSTKFFPSPPHESGPVIAQIADGEMSGFGEQFRLALEGKDRNDDPRSIMNFHVRGQLRTYERLAGDFAVAKRWFASLPGPTFPNRLCAIAGRTPFLDNSEIPTEDLGYLSVKRTVFDLLDEADINWRYYEHDLAFLRMVGRHRLDTGRIRPIEDFAEDAKGGLPAVTFIDPNFVDIPGGGVANDDHPGGADMVNGQTLVARVINGLMSSTGWENTLLVITYDEHGGFYDHVPPPGSAKSGFTNVPRVHKGAPAMLGVRVPAFIVSPRARPGDIIDRIYDHTSVLKSIIVRFLPGQAHRLGRRVERAAHLGGAVPLATPRLGIPEFPLFPPTPAELEPPESGSFHHRMRSMTSPFNQSAGRIKQMIPSF